MFIKFTKSFSEWYDIIVQKRNRAQNWNGIKILILFNKQKLLKLLLGNIFASLESIIHLIL